MNKALKIIPIALLLVVSASLAAEKTAGNRIDDSWIHTKVKSALIGEGASTINIEVHKGVVQLAGFVKSEEARDRAINDAGAVTGVVRVSNALIVQRNTRTPGRLLDDGVIAGKVKAGLAESKQTSSIEVNVEVRHGVVLLSGFVNTDAERDAAGKVASGVSGVTEVMNRIEVVQAG